MNDSHCQKIVGLTFVLSLFSLSGEVSAQRVVLDQARLIDEGFRIWNEETFDGNGRKCATCHLPEANYSISPVEISEMSDEDRALVFATNVPGLEEPTLVSEFASFNTKGGIGEDGQEREREFRGSMTIAALDLTSRNSATSFTGPFGPQLGWAGDGSPREGLHHGNRDANADGSMRAFTNGAIAQHSTKTLARVAGEDFRFATDKELDALEAFQRWLGRRATPSGRKEFAFAELAFSDPRIEQGKQVYMSPQATCNVCHTNGGANFAGGNNVNLNTGVESERERLEQETHVHIPEDEGGKNTPPTPRVPIALGAFNIQSVVEAPRKRVFFHNSAIVGDIEDAVRFYFSASFLDSIGNVPPTGDNPGHCDSVECLDDVTPQGFEKLGAFMRSLSAFYSLVDCERLLQESIDRLDVGASATLPTKHCVFALHDVRYVLHGAHLSPRPFRDVADRASELADKLEADPQEPSELATALELVRSLREAIATTPELP